MLESGHFLHQSLGAWCLTKRMRRFPSLNETRLGLIPNQRRKMIQMISIPMIQGNRTGSRIPSNRPLNWFRNIHPSIRLFVYLCIPSTLHIIHHTPGRSLFFLGTKSGLGTIYRSLHVIDSMRRGAGLVGGVMCPYRMIPLAHSARGAHYLKLKAVVTSRVHTLTKLF